MTIKKSAYGLTEVALHTRTKILTVEHRGNMGNCIADVARNVDHILGEGMFKELERSCSNMEETGTPDYLYTRKLFLTKVTVDMIESKL